MLKASSSVGRMPSPPSALLLSSHSPPRKRTPCSVPLNRRPIAGASSAASLALAEGPNGSGGWNPNWRSGYPAVRDLKAAIRYVRANADKYGVDASRIAVSGGSAGARGWCCTARGSLTASCPCV